MSLNSYSSLCDDFYFDMHVNTELDLPTERDTVLSFFERIRRQFPSMGCFYRRNSNEYFLEEDRNRGQYRWVSLEADRIGSGVVNPSDIEMGSCQHRLILELVPYMLSVSSLDIDSLDVTFAMDFDYAGCHDEVIAEALLGQSASAACWTGPAPGPSVSPRPWSSRWPTMTACRDGSPSNRRRASMSRARRDRKTMRRSRWL